MRLKTLIWAVIIIAFLFFIYDFKTYLDEEKKTKSSHFSNKNIYNELNIDNCIVPQGIVYYYLPEYDEDISMFKNLKNKFFTKNKRNQNNSKDYVEMRVLKISAEEKQALVYVQTIKSKKDFIYNKITYYKGERLWIDTSLLNCNEPL